MTSALTGGFLFEAFTYGLKPVPFPKNGEIPGSYLHPIHRTHISHKERARYGAPSVPSPVEGGGLEHPLFLSWHSFSAAS